MSHENYNTKPKHIFKFIHCRYDLRLTNEEPYNLITFNYIIYISKSAAVYLLSMRSISYET